MTCKEYRLKAWESLRDKWGTTAIITLIFTLLSSLAFVPFIGFVASFLVTGPLALGVSMIALKIVNNEEFTLNNMFDGFQNFLSAFLLMLINTIFTFLWSLLFIIPGIIKSISYSMSFYILAENPDMDANDARKESMRIMEGHKMDFFLLSLSFIGWILLVALTFGILLFWVLPYMQTAYTHFYLSIKPVEDVEILSEEVVNDDM